MLGLSWSIVACTRWAGGKTSLMTKEKKCFPWAVEMHWFVQFGKPMQVGAKNSLRLPLGLSVWVGLQWPVPKRSRQTCSTMGYGGFCPNCACPALSMMPAQLVRPKKLRLRGENQLACQIRLIFIILVSNGEKIRNALSHRARNTGARRRRATARISLAMPHFLITLEFSGEFLHVALNLLFYKFFTCPWPPSIRIDF